MEIEEARDKGGAGCLKQPHSDLEDPKHENVQLTVVKTRGL